MLRRAALVGAVLVIGGAATLGLADPLALRIIAYGSILMGAILLLASASTALITAIAPHDRKDKT